MAKASSQFAPLRRAVLLRALQGLGLGILFGTISVAPLDLAKVRVCAPILRVRPCTLTGAPPQLAKEDVTGGGKYEEEGVEREPSFAATARSRLVLFDHLMAKVMDGASFTFDYSLLVVVASILAGVGLVTDNTVVIVASMLVSPIMG